LARNLAKTERLRWFNRALVDALEEGGQFYGWDELTAVGTSQQFRLTYTKRGFMLPMPLIAACTTFFQ
jgi:hypothetical protein